jgi:predicted HTH transcriptional regulator
MGRGAETPNKGLRRSTQKSIAALMNSEGGTLILGVEDDGHIFGLDKDIALVGSRDKFEQTLVNLIVDEIGPGLSHYYGIRFEELSGTMVCVVEVDPFRSRAGVFVKAENPNKGKEFFVRIGNTTRSLDPEQTHAYLESRGG